MNNLIQFLQTIKDPRSMVMQMSKNTNNPMIQNMIDMANRGDSKGVRDCANNFFKENGRDLDAELNDIQQFIKF